MSIKVMSIVWEIDDLTPMQKLILLKLADNADDSGECWPSLKTIADACGCSSRTVSRAIVHFEGMGIIAHDRRYNQSNKYYFDIDTMSSLKSNEDTMSNTPIDTVSSPIDTMSSPIDTVSSLKYPMKTPCLVNEDTGVSLTIKNHQEGDKELDESKEVESNTTQQAEVGIKPSWYGWTDQSNRHLRSAPQIGAYIFNPQTGEQVEYEGEK